MSKIIFIEGVSGVGKSTLVCNLTNKLREKGCIVKSCLEFDYTNPIDFYCTAYFSLKSYEDFCVRNSSSVDLIRQNTIIADDVRLVRYYDEDIPLFNDLLISELSLREFCYNPKNLVPLAEYTRVYQAVWKNFFSNLDDSVEYFIFDGSLLHHPINDMMRNYNINQDKAAAHIKALLDTLSMRNRHIFYLQTNNIAEQLTKAHISRNQEAPSDKYIMFWENRFKNDMYVLNNINESYRIFDVSNNGWNTAMREILLSIV